MDWLSTVVAWSAIIAVIVNAVTAVLGRRDAAAAKHHAAVEEITRDRDYWRDKYIETLQR